MRQTAHEKQLNRIKRQANVHLSRFSKMELDLQEAVSDLLGVVDSIDLEMDKLGALRINVQKQIKGHQEALKHVGNFTGGLKNE